MRRVGHPPMAPLYPAWKPEGFRYISARLPEREEALRNRGAPL